MSMDRDDLDIFGQAFCEEALELSRKKNRDYAGDGDPFRNFNEFGALGILVRMSDKFSRIRTLIERGGDPEVDETIEDTLQDLLNYSWLLAAFLANGRCDQDEAGDNQHAANCGCPACSEDESDPEPSYGPGENCCTDCVNPVPDGDGVECVGTDPAGDDEEARCCHCQDTFDENEGDDG